jgi:hypothetical protein
MQASNVALNSNLIIVSTHMPAEKATRTKSLTPPIRPLGWRERYGTYAQCVVAAVAIFGLFLGIWNQKAAHDEQDFKYRVDARIDEKLKPVNTKVDDISEKLAKVESALQGIRSNLDLLLRKELKIAASLPQSQFNKNLDAVKTDLELAQKTSIILDRSVISELKTKIVLANKTEPNAWSVVLTLISYRSLTINNPAPSPLRKPISPGFGMHIDIRSSPTGELRAPIVMLCGFTTPDKAALYEEITPSPETPPIEHSEKDSAEYAMVDLLGQTTRLDGMRLKNIILRNAHIVYNGRSVNLENVYFVNCTFEFERDPTTQQLAAKLLESPSTTFKVS